MKGSVFFFLFSTFFFFLSLRPIPAIIFPKCISRDGNGRSEIRKSSRPTAYVLTGSHRYQLYASSTVFTISDFHLNLSKSRYNNIINRIARHSSTRDRPFEFGVYAYKYMYTIMIFTKCDRRRGP